MSTSDPLDFFDDVDQTAVVPRAPRRKRQLMDRLSIYLPVLLMGLLALASYWLLRATPAPALPAPPQPVSSEPDYFMRQFSVKAFDAQGELRTQVSGVEARHFPASDTVEIDMARIRHIGEQGLPTLARARLVTTNSDNTEFVLEGDAVVVREAGNDAQGNPQPRLEFQGEFLHVYLEPDRIVSDRPVTLLRGSDRLVADTLDYNAENQVALFKGRVKVQLVPR
ncbi:LPS export ABC transporter periplasmic protein LptC [Hydrogenophaga sp.]|uniref:LPS export ABC transporter periplasmic protein LptC n=1 Tax=Hydrogenophaga sp. TaxID=1904254 RepID=UPI002634C9B3|nr:LPS export ABC transporter periplasmic protein LptC [Hydrogenophaga sp.]